MRMIPPEIEKHQRAKKTPQNMSRLVRLWGIGSTPGPERKIEVSTESSVASDRVLTARETKKIIVANAIIASNTLKGWRRFPIFKSPFCYRTSGRSRHAS
jgi:hypothetical protein